MPSRKTSYSAARTNCSKRLLIRIHTFIHIRDSGLIGWDKLSHSLTKYAKRRWRDCNIDCSVLIYSVISGILMFVVIGFFLLIALGVVAVVFPIIGAMKASNGEVWKYPLTISFLK